MRRTKIVCTIGLGTQEKEMIEKLAKAGMNIARINMSHGTHAWTKKVVKRIQKVSSKSRFPIGLMVDTQGPEIRTSVQAEMGLEEGDSFKIAVSSACDIQEDEKHTFINYQNLIKSVKKDDIILIDDGMVALKVRSIEPHHINCIVLNKGKVGNKKSVNLPGIKVEIPSITEKDIADIKLGAELGMDFVAQSFVQTKEDVQLMRKYLKKFKSDALIIAKIEDQEGINNLDEIISEADGIMVARGDLGVEIPFEDIPIVQRRMVRSCIEAGKFVIIATHLLESMIHNPRPTRAEVTDVATAVFQRSDCIMLSGETTKGDYPITCVKTMHKIANKVQSRLKFSADSLLKTKDVKEAMTLGACINAENLDAKAIIVFSQTGRLLRLVTKNRPNIDTFVFTEDEKLMGQLMTYWGTFPYKIKFNKHIDTMVEEAVAILKKHKYIEKGDRVVIVSDVNPRKNIDILEIREIA